MRFRKDRRRWLYWLSAARRRYGLRVLNYIVTCNHVHLLAYDSGRGEIARSMQLVAGRTAQEFNDRRQRRGAFWEDRYHATAVSTDRHLINCMCYIDMNMVRAGVVRHPSQWRESGYCEIQNPPKRYRVIELGLVQEFLGQKTLGDLRSLLASYAEGAISSGRHQRETIWTEGVAVGSHSFVEQIRAELGHRAGRRVIWAVEGHDEALHSLRDGNTTTYTV